MVVPSYAVATPAVKFNTTPWGPLHTGYGRHSVCFSSSIVFRSGGVHCFYLKGPFGSVVPSLGCVLETLAPRCARKRTQTVTRVILRDQFKLAPVSVYVRQSGVASLRGHQRLRGVMGELMRGRPMRCVLKRTEFRKRVFRITSDMLVPQPRARRLIS